MSSRRVFDIDEWAAVWAILRDFVSDTKDGAMTFVIRRRFGKLQLIAWDRTVDDNEPTPDANVLPADLPVDL